MSLELLFLGSGTSAGVPMIACACPVCTSHDPRDQRSRPSVLISYPGDPPAPTGPRRLLIDTTPELRLQMIRQQIDRIDGVLITHTHADHIFGMDDLRRFNAVMETALDLYAEESAFEVLRAMFRYVFEPRRNPDPTFVPMLRPQVIEAGRPLDLFGAAWTPLRLMHGRLPILGFRVERQGHSLAYCTDVSAIPPQTYPLLEELDVLVLDALRFRHHPTHLTVEQALAVIEQVRPKRAYLTHIAHDIRHAELEPQLPEHVFLAFDGLVVNCGDGAMIRNSSNER